MARRLIVPFVLLLAVAACSDDGSPTLPVARSTSTVASSSSSTSSTAVSNGSTGTSGGDLSTTTPPGPGLPLKGSTGSGTFTWSAEANTAQFCYRITISGVGSATSARLLHGGDAVLTLVAPGANNTVNTCSPTDAITIDQLQQDPAAFALEVVADKGTLKGSLK